MVDLKDYKKIIILIISLFLFCVILLSINWFFSPQIKLNGSTKETILVGEKFKESGYQAHQGTKDLNNIVNVNGTVDTSKVGKYKIVYTVEYHGKTKTAVRTVVVEDKKEPVITLKGSDPANICKNKEYEEEGYEAIDNYDGDISNRVQVKKQKDKIIYQVKDSSGNETTKIRNIKEQDVTDPVLKLKGSSEMILYVGQTYTETGYEAIDNCDGDITSKVRITGTVDGKKEGVYQVNYQVEDSAGNKASTIRTVKVLKHTNEGQGKVIYLTFDDGPSRSITPKLLDILKEENVKATFFVINHAKELDYLIKREAAEGHTVALHSYTHNYKKIYSSVDNYFEDLTLIQEKVYRLIGKKPTIIRFPGGVSNTVSRRYCQGIMSLLDVEVNKRGYHYFDWNISSGDASGKRISSKTVYNNVVNNLNKKQNFVLMHDFENNDATLGAIRDIIIYGKSHGYTFKAIDETTQEYHHRPQN